MVKEIKPDPSLVRYIRLFRIIDFHFPDEMDIPAKVYPPRPEQCIQFFPKDTEKVIYPDSKLVISNRKSTITGQHNIVNHRYVPKEFLSVQVIFQPGAFYQITGISMDELANMYMDAEEILGSEIMQITEQLYFAKNHAQMIIIVEHYLSRLIKKSRQAEDKIDQIGILMLSSEDYKLDSFIKTACLSHRQFDRRFKERIGISPKQYLQIIRFEKAFGMKNTQPHKDWLSIALHCGYYDYQHLVRDYREFTGYTPNQFYEIENMAPERILEIIRPDA